MVVAASRAAAGQRSVVVSYLSPADPNVVGAALYHGASASDVQSGQNLTRIDLGAPAASGVTRVTVQGLDDTRDYYMALRSYDASGRESANSNIGVLTASAPPGALYSESFDSYAPGADPAGWVDSGSGVPGAGDASTFAAAQAADGAETLGVASSALELNATLVSPGSASWSSYDYSGRIESDSLGGKAGVTVLSQYPDAAFGYVLSRSGSRPYVLSKNGTGSLACVGTISTGVAGAAGEWLRFRVRVTRFDGRNRVRASLWPDQTPPPASFQTDCWDADLESVSSGRIGVYSSSNAGNHWDDLVVVPVTPDGAPPGYGVPPAAPAPPPTVPPTQPTPPSNPVPPPPPATGYTSESSLAHWWKPGWDLDDLGRDFAASGGIDAYEDAKGLNAKDVTQGGSSAATVDLDGKAEALGAFTLKQYGLADTWSVGAWVRPAKLGLNSKPRYILDLNGQNSNLGLDRISLTIDADGHFAVEVSDLFGRTRGISSPAGLSLSKNGDTWYFVTAVKTASRQLTLYVNGVQVAGSAVGVPSQSDVPRALRIGGRVKDSTGYFFKGSIGSVAMWRSALRPSEISALFAAGDRGVAMRPTLAH